MSLLVFNQHKHAADHLCQGQQVVGVRRREPAVDLLPLHDKIVDRPIRNPIRDRESRFNRIGPRWVRTSHQHTPLKVRHTGPLLARVYGQEPMNLRRHAGLP